MANTPCPKCKTTRNRVIDSRPSHVEGLETIRRRRVCYGCEHHWTTYEFYAHEIDMLFETRRAFGKARRQIGELSKDLAGKDR